MRKQAIAEIIVRFEVLRALSIVNRMFCFGVEKFLR